MNLFWFLFFTLAIFLAIIFISGVTEKPQVPIEQRYTCNKDGYVMIYSRSWGKDVCVPGFIPK